jgi:mandelate racemase
MRALGFRESPRWYLIGDTWPGGARPGGSVRFPEISAHLLAATPTAHWLEYHEWTAPIVQEPVALLDGHAAPSMMPGTGIAWDEAAVARCTVA